MLLTRLRSYVQLTKPTIMTLVVLTGSSALVMEGQLVKRPLDFLLVLVGLFLTGGSANALNQYFERDIDALMSRTRNRRPLPLGKISGSEALLFAIIIGVSGVLVFAMQFNGLSAALSLATIIFYGFFYTLWLKPNTHQNIVIGGVAGAMAPVIAWAAAADSLALEPWLLFLIIFLWTPPHFWALALYLKEDYKKVNLPMMPIVRGDEATLTQMFYYTVALVTISLSLFAVNSGILYLIVSGFLGGIFLKKVVAVRNSRSRRLERGLFRYSIIYLLSLFTTMIIEGLVGT
jgi:heme o synthase